MATYEILTQQALANIVNAVVANTYTPASPRKAMSYDEVVAVKNAIASTVTLTIGNFINNAGSEVPYNSGRQLVQKVRITATAAAPTIFDYTIGAKTYGATVLIASVHSAEDTVIPGSPIGYEEDNVVKSVTFQSTLNGTYLATLKENNIFKWQNISRSGIASYNLHYGGYSASGTYVHTKCVELPINENVSLRILLEHTSSSPIGNYTLTKNGNIYELHLPVEINTRLPKNTSVNVSPNTPITIVPDYDDNEGGNLMVNEIDDYTQWYHWPDGTSQYYNDSSVTIDSSLEIVNSQVDSGNVIILPIISNPTAGKTPVHRLSVFVRQWLYPRTSSGLYQQKDMTKLDVWVKRTNTSPTPPSSTKEVIFTVNAEIDSGGFVTPVLQVSFNDSVGPISSNFYVTGSIIGVNGTYPFTITPADVSGYLQNGNYYGNFDRDTVTSNILGSNPTISNSAYFNLENGWIGQIYNGIIRQM